MLLFLFRWSTGKWMFQGPRHHSVYFPWLPPPKAIHSEASWPRGAPQWEFVQDLSLLAHLVLPVGVLEGARERFVPRLSASARAVKTCALARGSRLLRYQYSSRMAVTKSTEAIGVGGTLRSESRTSFRRLETKFRQDSSSTMLSKMAIATLRSFIAFGSSAQRSR